MVLGYLTILVVGVVGNIIVLVVVLTNPHMQTTTNIYLVNLSLADILMCLGTVFRNMNSREEVFSCSVSVPLTPLSTFMGRWVLGETLCKLFPASQVRKGLSDSHSRSASPSPSPSTCPPSPSQPSQ